MAFSLLGPLLGGVASVVGAGIQSRSTRRAQNSQVGVQREIMDINQGNHEDTVARFDPYNQGGLEAYRAYLFENGLGPRPEGYQGMEASPAAQYMLTQGRDSIEAGAAGRGGLWSGATAKALEDHRTNTLLGDRENQLNRLASLAQGGQSAAGLLGNAGTNLATANANALSNIGNAQSAGAIASGNAWGNALQGLAGFGAMGVDVMNQPNYGPAQMGQQQYSNNGLGAY